MTQICTSCNEEQPLTEFAKKTGVRLNTWCKTCNKIYQREHYQKNKQLYKDKAKAYSREYRKNTYKFLMEYAKDGCVLCSEKEFCCLEFDHLDRSTKTFSIFEMISNGFSLEKIKTELTKCQILCANCHRKRTAQQFDWYKFGAVD